MNVRLLSTLKCITTVSVDHREYSGWTVTIILLIYYHINIIEDDKVPCIRDCVLTIYNKKKNLRKETELFLLKFLRMIKSKLY